MSERGASRRFARVLVTGGTGRLGRPLVARLLAAGYEVTALSRRLDGDLSDPAAARERLRPWRWDAVVNAAGPVPHGGTGVHGFEAHPRIVEAVAAMLPGAWPGRFIHISSMAVYGMPAYLPMDESHPLHPTHAYGRAKAQAEGMSRAAARDCWLLRCGGLFSEHRPDGALSEFLRAALRGEDLRVTAATPTPWDVLHVDDAVEAVLRALQSPAAGPGPVNVSYGEPVELTALAGWIAAWAGTGAAVRNVTGVVHPVVQLDIRRARSLLAWPPATLSQRLERWCQAVSSPAGAAAR